MNNMRQSIKRIFWLYVTLFICVILFLLKIVLLDSARMITNSYNPRLNFLQDQMIRGEIRDHTGKVLALTEKKKGKWVRTYPFGRDFAHIVGYVQKGKTGIEAYSNFALLDLSYGTLQRIQQALFQKDLQGSHVILTVDAEIQKFVRGKLGKRKGAVIVMEPSTGKILSIVSYPDFNPNEIEKKWEQLKLDKENSPLLNRATQGMYPPGSVFKIITAAAEMESNPQWESFSYACKGEDVFDGNAIRCFNSKVHGNIDLKKAFAVSCNTGFAQIGVKVGPEQLKIAAEKLYFNKPLPYPLEYRSSRFVIDKNSTTNEVVETAIGQGKTMVSPLHMALITSAIANGGVLMKPYIVDHMIDVRGNIKEKQLPQKQEDLFTLPMAQNLSQMMRSVVKEGTGTQAGLKKFAVAGKTGTAENPRGEAHAWFVGFAPADKPEVVVVVVLENAGSGGSKAGPLAREIFQKILN